MSAELILFALKNVTIIFEISLYIIDPTIYQQYISLYIETPVEPISISTRACPTPKQTWCIKTTYWIEVYKPRFLDAVPLKSSFSLWDKTHMEALNKVANGEIAEILKSQKPSTGPITITDLNLPNGWRKKL